jgi:hypothetical protein
VPGRLQTTLKTALDGATTPTYIDINITTANKSALIAMPSAGRVLIESEEISYTAKTVTAQNLRLTVGERNIRNSSIAAHAVGVTIRWLPFDIQIAYSNSAATAPDIDNTKKPVLDLANSTNASFVYANFYDNTSPVGRRAGSWIPSLLSTNGKLLTQSKYYHGTNLGANVDPSEVMGMDVSTYQSNGLYRAETASLEWRLKIPDGVSNVDSNGSKYRATAKWATVARLQSSVDGITWIDEWSATEATPASVTTWTAWTHNTEAVPSTTKVLRFFIQGSVTAVAGNYFALEVTAATLTLVNYPTVSLRAQESNYYLDATITNTTTGESIRLAYPLQTSKTLYIDTDPNQPYAKMNGNIVNVVKPNTNRSKWLKLQPGSNTLTFTADYASNITCVVKHRDRMNFI